MARTQVADSATSQFYINAADKNSFLDQPRDGAGYAVFGKVVAGFDVRVRDGLGHDLADGEVGQLWVRGNSRAIGYWQHMEKTQAAFRGEWYVSGDLVRRDADGYFTYCGRLQ